MQKNLLLAGIILLSCSFFTENRKSMKNLNKNQILSQLDSSIIGSYNNFVCLEDGYFEIANSRLTIFKNLNEWAIVFEKFGDNPRSSKGVLIETYFFGNCLTNLDFYNGESVNYKVIEVDNNIQEIIELNKKKIKIRDKEIEIPNLIAEYKKYNIPLDIDGNLYVGAILRYLTETYPEVTRASNKEVKACIPERLTKIMTIDNWYHEIYSKYEAINPPSKSETYQMVADVLITGDTSMYKPSKKPNNHWSNWLNVEKL